MREIKFRAWNKKEKIMVGVLKLDLMFEAEYGILVTGYADGKNGEPGTISYEIYPEDLELMQYTGLKDSAGKDIYEGDVINANIIEYGFLPTMGEIVYDNNLSAYCNKNLSGNTLLFKLNKIKIIGNRWENPELLEEG